MRTGSTHEPGKSNPAKSKAERSAGNRTTASIHARKPGPRLAMGRPSENRDRGATWALQFTLNGKRIRTRVNPMQALLDFLRIEMGLTGTKGACLEGECGSCYVLVDGKAMNSCLILTPQIQDRTVITIEGIGTDKKLSALQKAFIDNGAVQCGYCTPGFIVAAKALLDQNPHPSREELLAAVEGNLCRCTGYSKIVQALEAAAAAMENT